MTLSVAGALVELKLLDKRINKATNSKVYVLYQQGKTLPNGFKDVEEVKDAIKANNQSVVDLIKRRNTIKSALVVSNALTKVAIADVEMTVAEAIERKSSIEYDKQLLHAYKTQLATTLRSIDTINRDIANRADSMVQTFLGNEKSKSNEAEALRQNFINDNEAKLIDVIDIKKRIDELEDAIDNFEAEVDLVLSTSNAITQLEIA